jgi:hypothetical protein
VRWPLQPPQLCHPCITTIHFSYRFPIFETSATALCGVWIHINSYELLGMQKLTLTSPVTGPPCVVSRNDPQRICFGTSAHYPHYPVPKAEGPIARSKLQSVFNSFASARVLNRRNSTNQVSSSVFWFSQIQCVFNVILDRSGLIIIIHYPDLLGDLGMIPLTNHDLPRYIWSMSASLPWPDGQTDAEIAQDLARRAQHKVLHLSTTLITQFR